jgi:hypothetical protein
LREAQRVSSVEEGSSASPSSSSVSEDETSSTPNSSGTPVAPSADKIERIEMGRRIQKALESIFYWVHQRRSSTS